MKNPRCCEHTPEGAGPCHKCRFLMEPRGVKFVGSKREWLLLYSGRILQRAKTLSDILEVMKHVEEKEERSFRIGCPNGIRLSIEMARTV